LPHAFQEPYYLTETQLDQEARRLKEAAWHLPAGNERDKLLRKSRQLAVAAHISAWLSSPRLQPPRAAK
jgi:hypothetical protein